MDCAALPQSPALQPAPERGTDPRADPMTSDIADRPNCPLRGASGLRQSDWFARLAPDRAWAMASSNGWGPTTSRSRAGERHAGGQLRQWRAQVFAEQGRGPAARVPRRSQKREWSLLSIMFASESWFGSEDLMAFLRPAFAEDVFFSTANERVIFHRPSARPMAMRPVFYSAAAPGALVLAQRTGRHARSRTGRAYGASGSCPVRRGDFGRYGDAPSLLATAAPKAMIL